MAVSDRPSTKVERASARLIRSPLAQTVRRRVFRAPAPDCSACGSFDDVRHGLGFGDVDGVAASFLTDRSASSLRHPTVWRAWVSSVRTICAWNGGGSFGPTRQG